jgi:hypothetical protein
MLASYVAFDLDLWIILGLLAGVTRNKLLNKRSDDIVLAILLRMRFHHWLVAVQHVRSGKRYRVESIQLARGGDRGCGGFGGLPHNPSCGSVDARFLPVIIRAAFRVAHPARSQSPRTTITACRACESRTPYRCRAVPSSLGRIRSTSELAGQSGLRVGGESLVSAHNWHRRDGICVLPEDLHRPTSIFGQSV